MAAYAQSICFRFCQYLQWFTCLPNNHPTNYLDFTRRALPNQMELRDTRVASLPTIRQRRVASLENKMDPRKGELQ